MLREKCKCKAIQWQTVHSIFLIPNQELDENEDREGYELPASIHWHRGSARTSLWQSRDVSVTSTDWINRALLEAEFIKYRIILESEFLSLQCSTLTTSPFEGLEYCSLYLRFSSAAFLFPFSSVESNSQLVSPCSVPHTQGCPIPFTAKSQIMQTTPWYFGLVRCCFWSVFLISL